MMHELRRNQTAKGLNHGLTSTGGTVFIVIERWRWRGCGCRVRMLMAVLQLMGGIRLLEHLGRTLHPIRNVHGTRRIVVWPGESRRGVLDPNTRHRTGNRTRSSHRAGPSVVELKTGDRVVR